MRSNKNKIKILVAVIIITILFFIHIAINTNFIIDNIVPQPNKSILSNLNKDGGCLALTFDDGYKSDYNIAMPILKDNGFKGTFFVLPQHYNSPTIGMLNKTEIIELIKNNNEIGSHSITHPYLIKIPLKEASNEISGSKKIIENDFNITIYSFAVPYIFPYNKELKNIINKEYKNIRAYNYIINTKTNYNYICKKIKYAKENDKVMVLMVHQITTNPTSIYDTTKSDFEELINCAKESGINVNTLEYCSN